MGSIYKRGGKLWIKYFKNGRCYRESSGSDKKMVAKKLLEIREGEIAQGKLPGVMFEKVRFKELADEFLADYQINRKKSLARATQSIAHLKQYFGNCRIIEITTPRIREYIMARVENGAANATINRELSALKRLLNLGAKQTPPKVDRVPSIPMLKENNVRKGFFEHEHFVALREQLPEYLRGFVTFAYKVGWRESEITNLTWDQIDLLQGIVRLEVGQTKNDEGRTVYLDEELKSVFELNWAKRKKKGKLIPFVFPNEDYTGTIRDFRGAWNAACRKLGIGYGYKKSASYVSQWQDQFAAGPTLHDLRRTAVRNMIRAGIPERVAMMISGHKTRAVFDRYNIVSASDLKRAAQQQQAYLEEKKGLGTISGTIRNFAKKKGAHHGG